MFEKTGDSRLQRNTHENRTTKCEGGAVRNLSRGVSTPTREETEIREETGRLEAAVEAQDAEIIQVLKL